MRCKLSWVAGPPGRRGGGRAELTTRRGRPFVMRRISGRRVRAVSIVTVDGGSAADPPERAKADACVIQGVHRLVVEVEDQIGRFVSGPRSWGLSSCETRSCGVEPWLEIGTPDSRAILVLALRLDRPPSARTICRRRTSSSTATSCRRRTNELQARGVAFPQPSVAESFGWWSMFQDNEGNRFALQPREA
jgi:hypothetical protein